MSADESVVGDERVCSKQDRRQRPHIAGYRGRSDRFNASPGPRLVGMLREERDQLIRVADGCAAASAIEPYAGADQSATRGDRRTRHGLERGRGKSGGEGIRSRSQRRLQLRMLALPASAGRDEREARERKRPGGATTAPRVLLGGQDLSRDRAILTPCESRV